MAAITYNSMSPGTQLRKLSFSRSERELSFNGIFATDPSDLDTLLASLRVDDATLVITSAGYSETFELNSGSNTQCTELRTVVEKLGERSDGEAMALIRFAVTAKLQSFRADQFRRYSFSWEENDQGIFTLVVAGEVTGEGATSALSRFNSGIEAVENIGKALLGDADDGNLANTLFEDPQTVIEIDRNNGDLTFTRTFQQLPDPANQFIASAEARDATIVFPTWSVERIKTLRKGKNEEPLTLYTVQWTARLKQSKDQTAFISQYESTIQALVIKRIKEIFSESDTLILEDDRIVYGRTQQTAAGGWTVSSNEPFVSFSELISSLISVADSDPVADGQDFTEAPFSLGMRLDMTQIVTHVRRGTPPPAPSAPQVVFNGVPLQAFLVRFAPEEGNVFVGAEVGADVHKTGQAREYTLNWRAEYRAFAKTADDDFKKTVAGGKFMNVQGKLVNPVG